MEPRQAEELAEALHEAAAGVLTTKADLRELELRLRHDLTIRMGAIAATSSAAVVAILGLLVSLQ